MGRPHRPSANCKLEGTGACSRQGLPAAIRPFFPSFQPDPMIGRLDCPASLAAKCGRVTALTKGTSAMCGFRKVSLKGKGMSFFSSVFLLPAGWSSSSHVEQ